MSESHDPQQEPHNANVRYEHTDVNSRAAFGCAAGLATWLALVLGLLWGIFMYLFHSEAQRKQSDFPIAEQQRQATTEDQRLPVTGPIIEGFPAGDPKHTLGRYGPGSAQVKYAADEAWLASYGWLDGQRAIARIPIAEAMQRLIGKLPARQDASKTARDGAGDLPTVSSSGRATAGGPP
jgi:hypothetical protein